MFGKTTAFMRSDINPFVPLREYQVIQNTTNSITACFL